MSVSNQKEINILILGETGVGKSTFINAFANYLNFETIEESLNNNPICLIPTRFVVTDENFQQKHVSYGEDKNESYETVGSSVTQKCRAYCFQFGQSVVRLIDTPGVGDVRGTDQDKINFDNLLSFIAEYDVLHLICILFKPDQQRMTPSFVYCIKQLLCQLQKDACNNIVFVFTNSRSTLYRPKNTLVLLNKILEEIKSRPPNVEIPINKQTMYCLDNDSFQFLIAIRNDVKFDEEETKDFGISWSKSVNECLRLMSYITSGKNGGPLPPHSIQNILSIIETRRLIIALNKPIANMAEKIGIELKTLEKVKREVNNYQGDIRQYLENIKDSEYKFEASFWDFVPLISIFTIFYKLDQESSAKEKQAQLMEKLNTTSGKIKVKEELLQQMEIVISEYKQERKEIVAASARFAYFLKNNAIATYNDAYKDHLLEQIKFVEKSDESEEWIYNKVNNLKKILEEYEQEKEILEKNIQKSISEKDISLEQINILIKRLYALKHTGKEIQKLHEESKSKQGADVKVEVVHKIKQSKSERFIKFIKFW